MISKRLDKSLSALIKEADTVFSEFIRRRYAVNSGYVSCFICGAPMHWKQAHCGHFVDRDQMPTRYDEINCNAICEYCNCIDPDHKEHYTHRMVEHYGLFVAGNLKIKSTELQKFTRAELLEIIDTYKLKLKELK